MIRLLNRCSKMLIKGRDHYTGAPDDGVSQRSIQILQVCHVTDVAGEQRRGRSVSQVGMLFWQVAVNEQQQ